ARRLYRRPPRHGAERGVYAGGVLSRPHRGAARPSRRNEGGTGARGAGRRCAGACPCDIGDAEASCAEVGEAGGVGLVVIVPRGRRDGAAPDDATRHLPMITPITLGAARYFSSIAARAAARFSAVNRPRFSARIIQQKPHQSVSMPLSSTRS